MIGAASEVKKLNKPAVKMSGEKMAVRLVSDVNAAWIFPCSEGSTAPATSPWIVGMATPASAPKTTMIGTIQP